MFSYKNGNTNVELLEDGTKIRSWEDSVMPRSDFPESIDFKITNYCDMCCSYCHEKSTREGSHITFDNFDKILNMLSTMPKGIELAIGGGNPLSVKDVQVLIMRLKKAGFVCNLTVHETHVLKHRNLLTLLVRGGWVKAIGVSLRSRPDGSINSKLMEELSLLKKDGAQIVFHLLAGVHDVRMLDLLKDEKVLILGYKSFGFGENYISENSEAVEKSIYLWKIKFPSYINVVDTLSFDNLAIEQLNVRRIFTDRGWSTFYMGDDGTHSMYIDGDKMEVAQTSRSKERFKIEGDNKIEHYFNLVRKDK